MKKYIPNIILIILLVAVDQLIKVLILGKKYEFDKKAILGMTLILAGGIGNLMDRIIRGFVIDYFDITPIFDYPVFNFADICIVVGVILLFIIIIVNTVKSQEKSIDEKV